MPRSSIRRRIAWEAPRALNAPMRCMFSHLKKRRIFGLGASLAPFWGGSSVLGGPMISRSAGFVDAMRSSVRHVMTGVLWMSDLIFSWASWTDWRVNGGHLEGSAMVE